MVIFRQRKRRLVLVEGRGQIKKKGEIMAAKKKVKETLKTAKKKADVVKPATKGKKKTTKK